ncbi:hypothetical protein N7931_03850 [Catenovulum sp. 2E275]|uniref:hypothetical protein n=1 Tax=Catenovulum sp. 2E275 TaxID=2980497 RepID=UPI0021D14B9B|nr:hypothetical protein [Catenovulum sp. 2E275]MCU4674761.1 hypothetical protein [Catenovulum sp. 2E275]
MQQFNSIALDHDLTPELLRQLNAQVSSILKQTEIDSSTLLKLIDKRDELISDELKKLNGQVDIQKQFIEQELIVNRYLVQQCQKLFNNTEKELVNLKKSQKAIKHYK